ncbi:hypothetical protein BGX28_001399 [Mortierella sp. GBA30]|nr:hypothetical protein BGX28_001399 [Mortierella sp. GBA30]
MLIAGFLVWSGTAVMIMLVLNMNSGVYQSSGIYFMVWFLVGIFGSLVSFYLWHVGIILTGAYGMFVVIALIFTAINVQNYAFRYTVLAIFIVLGGYLTHRYERLAVILATSLGGAYCMMFGLDMFVQSEFRATFHVMLSQSTARFHPVAGTWVMVACVPVITVFGVIWELKHHEEPVGSWWFGHGARPLPPLPGEKPIRRCCGIPLSRSAKSAKMAAAAAIAKDVGANDPGSSSEATLVVPTPSKDDKLHSSTTSFWICCLSWRAKRDNLDKTNVKKTTTADKVESPEVSESPPTSPPSSTAGASTKTAEIVAVETEETDEKTGRSEKDKMVAWSEAALASNVTTPIEKARLSEGHETIGHAGVYKVVIKREVREFGVSVDEHL